MMKYGKLSKIQSKQNGEFMGKLLSAVSLAGQVADFWLGSDAVAANSIANIVKNLIACLCIGLVSDAWYRFRNRFVDSCSSHTFVC